jgi:hypothetical protein
LGWKQLGIALRFSLVSLLSLRKREFGLFFGKQPLNHLPLDRIRFGRQQLPVMLDVQVRHSFIHGLPLLLFVRRLALSGINPIEMKGAMAPDRVIE